MTEKLFHGHKDGLFHGKTLRLNFFTPDFVAQSKPELFNNAPDRAPDALFQNDFIL